MVTPIGIMAATDCMQMREHALAVAIACEEKAKRARKPENIEGWRQQAEEWLAMAEEWDARVLLAPVP